MSKTTHVVLAPANDLMAETPPGLPVQARDRKHDCAPDVSVRVGTTAGRFAGINEARRIVVTFDGNVPLSHRRLPFHEVGSMFDLKQGGSKTTK